MNPMTNAKTRTFTLTLAAMLLAMPAHAQLNCGSNGSRGPLSVPSGQTVTLDIPNDGIFHFSTISVTGVLQFNKNVAFNPPPLLLATGDVTVAGTIRVNGSSGTALVAGTSGPGGFDGGAPGIAGGSPGAGLGPGGGAAGIGSLLGGNAGYGEPGQNSLATNGVAYGSGLLVPLVGGSGGGGDDGSGGGGGGGAVLLCSPTQILVSGFIDAFGDGPSNSSRNGSGGAIRLLAPTVRGNGSVRVAGGSSGWGGHGRIRVDLIDRTGLSINFSPASALSVGSLMTVFPSVVPRLDIVSVAGNGIAQGAPSPLVYTLPFNAPASQAITVRATGFTGIVPIAVVVTPDSGNRIVVNTQINADAQPAEATVNVDLPQNIAVRVHAWTR